MVRRSTIAKLIVGLAISAAAPGGAHGQIVVADLSKYRVAITTGFTGADVLLFGSVDDREGDVDVVVVVRGPLQRVVVRHKEEVAGVWFNSRRLIFRGVPGFYAVAASKPLKSIVSSAVARRNEIGAENIRMVPISNIEIVNPAAFQAALIRNRRRSGLFAPTVSRIRFLGHRLFSTTIHFPANVPTGRYTVHVHVLRNGQEISGGDQTVPLLVEKAGVSAEIFEFAHSNSVSYGLIAIVIAAFAGWLAAQIFRRS